MSYLAVDLQQLGRYDESEKLYLEAVALHRRVLGPEDPRTISIVNDLGFLYLKQGRFREAEPIHRANLEIATRVLPPTHDMTLWATYNLGWSCMENGKIEEAAPLIDRCLRARIQVLGREHQRTIVTIHMKARVTLAQGRYREARDLFRDEIEGWKGFGSGHHPEMWWAYQGEAHASYLLGDLKESRRQCEFCMAAYRRGELPDEDTGRGVFRLLCTVYKAGGWTEPARKLKLTMLPVWRRQIADGGDESFTAHLGVALALLDEGHGSPADAEEALREAKRALELMDGRRDCDRCSALAAQALAHHLLGHASEAVAAQRDAIEHVPSAEKALRARFESELGRYVGAAGR
jgi:tetratricopeptide (TPR) repeat protein